MSFLENNQKQGPDNQYLEFQNDSYKHSSKVDSNLDMNEYLKRINFGADLIWQSNPFH